MSENGDEYIELVSILIDMITAHTLTGEYRAGDPSGTREIRLPPVSILGSRTTSMLLLIEAKPVAQPQDRLIEGTIYQFDHSLLVVTKLKLQGYYEAAGTEAAHFFKPTMQAGPQHRATLQELQYLRDAIWNWPSDRRGR